MKPSKKLTDAQALARIEKLAERIRQFATPLSAEPKAQQERLAKSAKDFWFFAKTYFPHHASAEPAMMHREAIGAMRESGAVILRMPRGFGKTTITQLFCLWCLLFNKKQFILIIGKSDDTASEILQTILLEAETNERLIQDFGEQKTGFWSERTGYRFKRFGNWIDYIGRGSPIRGRKKGSSRPDLVIADDIEDDQLVANPKRVKQLLGWWLSSVIPAMAIGGTCVWLCTSLGQKSPSSLLLDPEWSYEVEGDPPVCTRLSFPAINADNEAVWPQQFSLEVLNAIKGKIGSTAFNREYMHLAEPEGNSFRAEWLGYYEPKDLPSSGLVTVMVNDPSAKSDPKNDPKGVLVVSRHLPTDRYFIRHAWIRRESTNTLIEKLFELDEAYNPVVWIIETQTFAIYLVELIRIKAKKKGKQPPIRTVEQSISKESRIKTLEPAAENLQFLFLKGQSDQEALREQLIYWPGNLPDEGPDCLEMAYDYLRKLSGNSKSKYSSVSKRKNFAEAM